MIYTYNPPTDYNGVIILFNGNSDKLPASMLAFVTPLKEGQYINAIDEGKYITIVKVFPDAKWKNTNIIRTVMSKLPAHIDSIIVENHASEEYTAPALIGLTLSEYAFSTMRTDTKSKEIDFYFDDCTEAQIVSANATATSMKLAMKIIDLPPNIKHPDYVIKLIQQLPATYPIAVKVLDKQDLVKGKFDAITAVGQGSKYGSYLAMMHYMGNPDSEDIDLVLIGKGVTFDTGGVSLKGSTNMHYMKSDCGGAAAAVGGISLIAAQNRKLNVMALTPIVENAIDNLSIRPGDVISSYSGKTIEVIDTDAEGRLILADALAYAVKDIKPKYIVDLATLTGNCVAALGTTRGGLFSKNKELSDLLYNLGESTGDRVWPLPVDDEYAQMMQSDIADIKNFHGRPYAGAITAAKFLELFTDGHTNWAHLDIAGVAYGDTDLVKSKVATGWGVQLLDQLALHLSINKN